MECNTRGGGERVQEWRNSEKRPISHSNSLLMNSDNVPHAKADNKGRGAKCSSTDIMKWGIPEWWSTIGQEWKAVDQRLWRSRTDEVYF